MQAVCQVEFTDVLIVVRLDVDGQTFAPIGLHKIDAASDWLLMKGSYRRDFSIYQKDDVLFQPKIRGAFEKIKNQPRHLLRPTSVNFSQFCQNLSHETVPLSTYGEWAESI
jgi:hypothetical protein